MNALFLKDLAEKTPRGLRGRIEGGKSGGGLCYGYRVVKTLQGSQVSTGEREIEPAEAAIVQRVFRDFVAGHSPKKIAQTLNREGVPGPFGSKWSPSTLYGNARRGTGLLNNALTSADSCGICLMIQAIEDGFGDADLKVEWNAAQERKAALQARLEGPDEPLPLLHPGMADLYREKVTKLAEALEHPDTRTEAAEAIRGLIDAIVLTPAEGALETLVVRRGLEPRRKSPRATAACASN
jgi:hypothetical protein